ncbi:glucuronate isomerase [Paratractidigestivibacter sp.]|uniref:glucuronate isomerase n=1 Tax=Paratractidigestivibacter sp. TaxID=2847316 RepID=UPI002AC8C619|nr:glucuronate isomerase [Paratractidigestivibacter sp.]
MQFNDDFLLTTEWARKLFHRHAEKMPIIDYHCHLVPSEIHENKGYENLAQVWLYDNGFGDHYKWRLMRANGTPESVIRGDDDHAKYLAFVDAVERAVGNPIYDWSHLELRRFFGIEERICRKNAETIWERANALITTDDFRAKRLIQRMNVTCVCTTDDPASDLAHHKLLAAEEAGNGFKVLPTFRPDGLMGIDCEGFSAYCDRLSDVSGIDVVDWESLKAAAAQRIDFFHEAGGRLADHGMNSFVFCPASDEVVDQIVCRALNDEGATAAETAAYQSALALFLMGEYATHDWTLQLHMNCFRNDSSKNFGLIGVDAGFDTVGDQPDMVYQVKCLLDAAESADGLPKCILYSLNESDWLGLASLCGAFQSAPARPRIQFGNAWWFNDTFSGMKKQLTMCAEQGLLGNFTGMLTDSRSFMSYPRHEYFRRILCHTIGEWVEMGRLPEDEEYLGGIVEDICYNNAHDYFGFFE